MHLNVVHLDDAFEAQPAFAKACAQRGAHHVDARGCGGEVRLWARPAVFDRLAERLRRELKGLDSDTPVVTWLGSGDFHHVTALLAETLASIRRVPLTIVHFDRHPDWVKTSRVAHCGSWVSMALRSDAVRRVISLGVSSSDLRWAQFKRADLHLLAAGQLVIFPLNPPETYARFAGIAPNGCQTMTRWPEAETVASVQKAIGASTIYITIDKDILCPADAGTNWDQGDLSLDDLLAWLRLLVSKYDVAGIDVIGDGTVPKYAGPAIDRLWKRAEAFIDQPSRSAKSQAASHVTNDRTNTRLLDALEGMIC